MRLWKNNNKENIIKDKIADLRTEILEHSKNGRYEEMVDLSEIRNIVKENLGENHLEYAQTLLDLASLYSVKRNYSEAELLHQQALDIRLNLVGQDHPDYAVCLHDLAWMYYSKGEYDNAERLYLKAYDIYRKIFRDTFNGSQKF